MIYDNVLPEGIYWMEITDVRGRTFQSGEGCEVVFTLEGTDREEMMYFLRDNENAAWSWKRLAPEFDQLFYLSGTRHLVDYRHERIDSQGIKRGRIVDFLARGL